MKERTIKVLKCFFIILGIIFFIQILVVLAISSTFAFTTKSDFDKPDNVSVSNNELKKIQPIIDYAENYWQENQKYPENINKEQIKIKSSVFDSINYALMEDKNCYTISMSPDYNNNGFMHNSKKNNKVRQYKKCKIKKDNFYSNSESYLEYTK